MKSIYEEIFFESRGMYENTKASDKYKIIADKLNNYVKKFKEGLSEKQIEQLEELSSLYGELEQEAAFVFYRAGVKTGLTLFAENL